MDEEQCPTDGCDGVDTFIRFVVDSVSSNLDGETGEFEDCGDSDMLKEENQGIFRTKCGEKVG